jgi:hypothetical protein
MVIDVIVTARRSATASSRPQRSRSAAAPL